MKKLAFTLGAAALLTSCTAGKKRVSEAFITGYIQGCAAASRLFTDPDAQAASAATGGQYLVTDLDAQLALYLTRKKQ